MTRNGGLYVSHDLKYASLFFNSPSLPPPLSLFISLHVTSYLLSMQSEKDIKEYLTEILGGNTPALREFQQEFMLRWHPPERPPSVPSVEEQRLLEPLVRPRQEEMVLFADRKSGGEGGGNGGEGGGKGKDRKKVCCHLGGGRKSK